jgi:5-methylcytosine-specific restriction endonuclease McrBC regulatory subunit McrC
LGSQKALVPDLWLESGDTTFVVDAKYKRHFEELQVGDWTRADEELRERHQSDLFQVLAYANLPRTPRVVACLVYPCAVDLWEDLRQRGRLFHKAQIAAGARSVSMWLTAVPMGLPVEEIVSSLEEHFRLGANVITD